ncbi:helix-turn-helix transcriptional regulator [Streptomyces sp. RY43-2]|uniref:Helix-turn-helix transcriptional regulator n=1 Tax=Streptomyces macrolidinus TaxID=2952607 RepID=A0ABT0Z8I0_9ACTN|nr:PadR family transcriptional regulator [Streptomyces macrolidinus]MCN9240063.1 helix-turn-helix transcriptional regulator [Streptomyces macrolidinus]
MPPVFAHGRLRLYLLKLLDEAPRHGYEVIRLLEERFQGLYAPSAGTVYPRLAKLEAEGLVTHTTEGGRKVYAITDAGRAELADRSGELADLELEIRESVAELAAEIRADVRGAAGDLRREMRAAATEARQGAQQHRGWHGEYGDLTDKESWRAAKEEMRRAKQEWKEQARRAKDESRRARDEAQRARRQADEAEERARAKAQEELQRMARRVQEQVQDHFARGDWPTGVREGLTELAKEFGEFGKAFGSEFGKDFGKDFGTGRKGAPGRSGAPGTAGTPGTGTSGMPSTSGASKTQEEPEYSTTPEEFPGTYEPSWAHEDFSGDPARALDRLLDRFRDDIRDMARDHGVSEDQLREARRHLSTAAAHIGATLRAPKG